MIAEILEYHAINRNTGKDHEFNSWESAQDFCDTENMIINPWDEIRWEVWARFAYPNAFKQ